METKKKTPTKKKAPVKKTQVVTSKQVASVEVEQEELLAPVVEDKRTQYLELLQEINRAFDFFNERFAKGELKRPIITVSPSGAKRAYGWFGPQFWKQGDREVHEINLSAEHFERTPEDVLETLLHEMAHLKNAQNKIVDYTVTQYHNKHFKIAAESFGLKVDKMRNRGFALTSLTEEGKKAIEELNPKKDLFNIYRKTFKRLYMKRYIPLLVRNTEQMKEIIEELTTYAGNKTQAVEDALILAYRTIKAGKND